MSSEARSGWVGAEPNGFSQPFGLAVMIAVVAAVTVGAAWAYQAAGYVPCELCLKERLPYYAGMPLALVTAVGAARGARAITLIGFGGLILCFMAGTALGIYHSGVELKIWAGPTECSGVASSAADVGDFFKQLNSVNVVRCDEPALKVLGLSLAVWNTLVCVVILGLANAGLLRAGRAPVSGP